MRHRFRLLVESELGDVRPALLNPVGITLLLLSVLPYLALLVASLTVLPGLVPLAGRAVWLLPLGVVAYLATVVACLLMPPAWPADAELQQLLDIRTSMHERLRELRAEGANASGAALLPEVAASARRMDRQVVPTFGQIVIKRNRLDQQLARYDRGELKLPDPAILGKLRRRNHIRQSELNACLQQAANAYAMLLALLNESDGLERRAQLGMWARDLEDIYDALVEVRGGLDYYDRALLGPAPGPGEGAAILDRLDLEAGLEESAAPAPEVKAKPKSAERSRTKAYPDGLTEREVEVLRLIADGKTSKEIANQLIVTIATVSRHVANIYDKIGAHGRADATRYAYEHGLIGPEGGDTPPAGGLPAGTPPAGGLSAFEAEVLRLIIEGKTNEQIAGQLRSSGPTVAKAIAAITTKIAARKVAR